MSDVPVLLNLSFGSSVQPYLIASFRYDPVELAKSFRAPLLVVTGSTDIQVSEEDGIRLSKARPGIHHQRINKMNHVLKLVAVNDRIVQIPTYIDPTLPLHPELVPAIAEFLRKALVKSE